jgi:FtsP/CotA-like multicopper oxidase with cupredoxin domain
VNQPTAPAGKTRMYYVSADEVEWDYAPHNMDHMTGKPFDKSTMIWVEKGKDRIGQVYRKAIYREYTDSTFQTLKPRTAEYAHMGILGPVIHAEVGDTIRIVFRNNATQLYGMHPHGVSYAKESEGAPYAGMSPESTGLVAPGHMHTYIWEVPERAGPGPDDGSSVMWLYHSHNYEPKDVNAGLIGPIVITAKGMARADGSPKDVERELFALFMIIDENQSHYLQHNIDTYAGDPKSVKKLELVPEDADGNADLTMGHGFALVNHKFTINGFIYGNNPPIQIHKGEHVRWYLMTMGDGFNFHTPHWHGNIVTVDKHHTDILSLAPAQFVVADMTPDNVGTWMFHCHLSDHMAGGMMTSYEVLP